MTDGKYQPEDVMGRLAALEARADGFDTWRAEKSELDTSRHRENRELLQEISAGNSRRETLLEENDRKRLEKLNAIEEQLKTIALQTARDDGARDQRRKIAGGFAQLLLAAISGGLLIELGRYFSAITRWFRSLP